jgi:uncharacterized membrane protein
VPQGGSRSTDCPFKQQQQQQQQQQQVPHVQQNMDTGLSPHLGGQEPECQQPELPMASASGSPDLDPASAALVAVMGAQALQLAHLASLCVCSISAMCESSSWDPAISRTRLPAAHAVSDMVRWVTAMQAEVLSTAVVVLGGYDPITWRDDHSSMAGACTEAGVRQVKQMSEASVLPPEFARQCVTVCVWFASGM